MPVLFMEQLQEIKLEKQTQRIFEKNGFEETMLGAEQNSE